MLKSLINDPYKLKQKIEYISRYDVSNREV